IRAEPGREPDSSRSASGVRGAIALSGARRMHCGGGWCMPAGGGGPMKTYLDLLRQVLDHGERRTDRTGTGTLSLFGLQARYDLREGFPLVTTKKVIFESVKKELLWFLRGETNTKTLGCGIWDAWADAEGELGPIYGHQWRRWGAPAGERGLDQIARVVTQIGRDPSSRRLLVSAWNVSDLDKMALAPCHALFQF